MNRAVLYDSTGRTQLYGPAEYHLYSASTKPRGIDWFGERTLRWLPLSDPDRARNLPEKFITHVTSAGPDDVVMLSLYRSSQSDAFLSLYSREGNRWVEEDLFRRVVEGPSLFYGPLENVTIQEIEDSAFGKNFIECYRPALAQIGRLAELNEGWDSYGANRIDTEAIGAAVRFLGLLHGKGVPVAPPIVGPSPSGGVALQWFLPQFEIFTEISSEAAEFYVARSDEDEVFLEGTAGKLEELASTISPFLF